MVSVWLMQAKAYWNCNFTHKSILFWFGEVVYPWSHSYRNSSLQDTLLVQQQQYISMPFRIGHRNRFPTQITSGSIFINKSWDQGMQLYQWDEMTWEDNLYFLVWLGLSNPGHWSFDDVTFWLIKHFLWYFLRVMDGHCLFRFCSPNLLLVFEISFSFFSFSS